MGIGRPNDYDVAIIGCGPVGLALAELLGRRGLTVLALDPNRLVCQHPRATHLDDETMRNLQTLGLAGMEGGFLNVSSWTLHDRDGRAFLAFDIPHAESDQAWQMDYMFHQPDFESALRGRLAGIPGVTMLLGWTLVDLAEIDGGAQLDIEDRRTSERRKISAGWVVGADGANSFVRRWMDPEVENLQGTQRSLIVDIHPFEHPANLPRAEGFVIGRRNLPVTYVPIYAPMLRFEFMLSASDMAHELEDPVAVYRLLSEWITPGTYRILRTDTYEWHARLVKGWRKGRVLLAGDAAHTMPPMLGQGMCSGLRDAFNLAWKLDLVHRGLAPESLLDSYESERSPHVRPYIVESARQSNLIENLGFAESLPEMGERQTLERLKPLLGPGLIDVPQGAVGQLAPQPRGTAGERLDDVTGYNFVILAADAVVRAAGPRAAEIWGRLGAKVLEPGSEITAWLASNGAAAAIIRPDRYAQALAVDAAALAEATDDLAARVLNGTAALQAAV